MMMNNKLEPISMVRIVRALMTAMMVFALTLVVRLIGHDLLGEGVIAIIYLVPIGWATVRWGQTAGVSAALTAALCFDFFFIPPYNTFTIGSLEGWLLFFLFIAVSILVVGRIQTILGEEQNRGRKATFLYEMVAAIANQQSAEGIARAVASQIQQKYLAEFVEVSLNSRGRLPAVVVREANQPDTFAKVKPDRALPIFSGPTLIGVISIWKGVIPLPAEDDPMLQTLLHQTAAALDRVTVTAENGTTKPI
jgi:K+-sensing histidine kinase KdpD